jgi:hypothetical protein
MEKIQKVTVIKNPDGTLKITPDGGNELSLTKEEADSRAKFLQDTDPYFHVFVGEVGKMFREIENLAREAREIDGVMVKLTKDESNLFKDLMNGNTAGKEAEMAALLSSREGKAGRGGNLQTVCSRGDAHRAGDPAEVVVRVGQRQRRPVVLQLLGERVDQPAHPADEVAHGAVVAFDVRRGREVEIGRAEDDVLGDERVARRLVARGGRWGRIINISSVVAPLGQIGQTNYSASKAGLIGLTRSLALELAPYNITVNAIAPGLIETAMTAKSLSETERDRLANSAGQAGETGRDCRDGILFASTKPASKTAIKIPFPLNPEL